MMVRQATFDDVEGMMPITKEMYRVLKLDKLAPYDELFVEFFLASCINDDDKLGLVAIDDDGVPVGLLMANTLPHWFSPNTYYAQEMMFWVVRDARGHKLGDSLMNGFEAWAKGRGLKIAGMSASGVYQRRRLETRYGGRGYVETAVYFFKEL
jgi:GNAT superfamily N-acetyltransferase